jgi:hypothetical protein
MRQAVVDSKGNDKPIHLMMVTDSKLTPLDLNYHGGERYPALQKIDGATDYLDEITKPLTAKP